MELGNVLVNLAALMQGINLSKRTRRYICGSGDALLKTACSTEVQLRQTPQRTKDSSLLTRDNQITSPLSSGQTPARPVSLMSALPQKDGQAVLFGRCLDSLVKA
ncbi:hypothetical protein WJX79_005944 [Trebouxia sp. C0005]